MNLALDPSFDPVLDPRLEQIRSRVAPVVLAHEQTMPVATTLAELFAERALVRGRTLACTGPAATSVAMEMVAAAVVAGSWLAVVDVPTFGLDAASETGIPLERIVAITTETRRDVPGAGSAAWVDVMAAVVDGFDVVVTRQPDTQTSAAALRKLSTRIRQRGAVVVMLLGDTGRLHGDELHGDELRGDELRGDELRYDGVIDSAEISWSGLGDGYGHLQARTIDLSASGRRLSGRRRCRVSMPSPSGAMHAVSATAATSFGGIRVDVA